MEAQANHARNRINISDDVISTIAGVAAMECAGVVGMSLRSFKEGITELLRKDNFTKGIEISVHDDSVTVSLFIIVAYGVKISETARNVQEKVRQSIENMTGMKVEQVNINVTSVRPADG